MATETSKMKQTPVISEENYKQQREKNNIAVRKSREKSKQKIEETKKRVAFLKKQNVELVNQIDVLNRELKFLKELFDARHCNSCQTESNDISIHSAEEIENFFSNALLTDFTS